LTREAAQPPVGTLTCKLGSLQAEKLTSEVLVHDDGEVVLLHADRDVAPGRRVG
jgi:hypothetical protein